MNSTKTTYTQRHTMYNLLPLMAKTAILCIVPKTIDLAYEFMFETKEKAAAEPKKNTRTRHKTVDMTPLTKLHFDHTVRRHKQMVTFNDGKKMKDRIRVPELVELLNQEFGLHKSGTAYSNIYGGLLTREDMPEANATVFPATVQTQAPITDVLLPQEH